MMDSQESESPASSVGVGSRIGPNRIIAHVASTLLGEFYKIFYGTTTHAYGMIVLDPAKAIDFDSAKNVLDELMSVSHTCLARPYACGFNDGVGWIRTELSNEPSANHFGLPKSVWTNHDETEPVPNGVVLMEICGGVLPEGLFVRVVGDLLEGLSELHNAGFAVGPFAYDNILFQRDHGYGDELIAKWIGYGFGLMENGEHHSQASASLADDVVSAGRLFKRMLFGDSGAVPGRGVSEAWTDFFRNAERAGNGGFANAAEMYSAFTKIADGRGFHRIQRKDALPQGTIFEPPSHDRSRHHHRHHSSKLGYTSSGKTPIVLRLKSLFKFMLAIGGIGLFGFGGYWFASADVRKSRQSIAPDSGLGTNAPPAMTAVLEESSPVWLYSRQELNLKHEGGDAEASMCLAFRIARGTDGEIRDPEKAQVIATGALEILERTRARDGDSVDGDTLLWIGYAKLTGLGTAIDPVGGRKMLEDASSRNLYALLVLSDYLASGPVDRNDENDRRALSGWQRVADALPQKSPLAVSCVEKAVAFILAGRGLPTGSAETLVKWVQDKAHQRYLSAIIGYSRICEEGKLAEKNDFTAIDGYRTAALSRSPEGMRRFAWMFEKGTGAPQSEKSASIWFHNAADAGDVEAMKIVAGLVERGTEEEPPDQKKADEWRAKADEAEKKNAGVKPVYDTWWQSTPVKK